MPKRCSNNLTSVAELAQVSPSPESSPETLNLIISVVDWEELTPEEERDRLFLERKVERAFYEAGKALQEIRDRRLYRSTHKTFEDYCRERFTHSRQKANFLIAGAIVYDNLTTICCQNSLPEDQYLTTNGTQNSLTEDLTTNESQILPTNEAQCRPLTKLEPDQQREAWQQAVEAAGGKVPSSRIVSDIVQRIREKTRVPNPYRVGDVCTIIAKDNPELRGLGGCWGIVIRIAEFSSIVRAWNGEYAVREENLKDLGYSPSQKEETKQISDRLSRLYDSQMEETAKAILESLGKINRFYLTSLEDKLLKVLEEESV